MMFIWVMFANGRDEAFYPSRRRWGTSQRDACWGGRNAEIAIFSPIMPGTEAGKEGWRDGGRERERERVGDIGT